MGVKREVPILEPFYLELFLDKADVVRDMSVCWEWQAALGGNRRYGTYKAGKYGSQHAAHVWSYRYFVGPIPVGMDVHHKCYNTKCINWTHLQLLTPRENSVDRSNRAWNMYDECLNGHPRTEENTYYDPRGWRECKLCREDASRRCYLGR
jgi:hypothetical protein